MKLKIPIVEVQPIKHHESVSDAVLSCYPQDTMDGMEWNVFKKQRCRMKQKERKSGFVCVIIVIGTM